MGKVVHFEDWHKGRDSVLITTGAVTSSAASEFRTMYPQMSLPSERALVEC
jgi:hypothetical protein